MGNGTVQLDTAHVAAAVSNCRATTRCQCPREAEELAWPYCRMPT